VAARAGGGMSGGPRGERFGCVAGIQARMGSTRLPGKVLADLCGRSLVQRVYQRTRAAALLDEVFVLTSDEASDDPLAEHLARAGIPHRRGSLADVRARFLDLAEETRARYLVRVSGDCPFVAPEFIDLRLGALRALEADLVDVANDPGGALAGTLGGQDAFSARALRFSCTSDDARDAEHVGSFFFLRRPPGLRREAIEVDEAYRRPGLRLQVDEAPDLELAREVWRAVDHEGDGSFPLLRALRWIEAHPDVRERNRHVRESADNQALRALARRQEALDDWRRA
jgi:spore coat polysaccharide biosynthesis protein SpsF (cytidylyltransferase family)